MNDIKVDPALKNIINVYDNLKHPNEDCQKIKDEWKKYCDCLNNSKINCNKEQESCRNTFNNYFICYIEDKKIKN